jgi:hypothetical protein
MQRRKFNPKRRLCAPPNDPERQAELVTLSQRVQYGGNPDHKRNPGDFGLTPPSNPRTSKTLCDDAGIVTREEAERVLRRGVEQGLISDQERDGFPQNVWGVADNGVAVEAMLENSQLGTYHGYPMTADDPLEEEVRRRWRR